MRCIYHNIIPPEFLCAEDAKDHVLYVSKTTQTIGTRMRKHIYDYDKAVELYKVFTDQEKAIREVFNAGQEMIALYKYYATEEPAESIEPILIDYFRDENTNSDSGNPSLDIVYLMFPEKNDDVAELIYQDFLDGNTRLI